MVARLLLAAAFVAVAAQAHADPLCANQKHAAVVASAATQTETTVAATETEAVVLPDETGAEAKTAQAVE